MVVSSEGRHNDGSKSTAISKTSPSGESWSFGNTSTILTESARGGGSLPSGAGAWGASAETVASELGVSGWSLSRWRRGLSPEKNSTLQLVQVVPECAEEGTKPLVTLVTPDGYRVEGLERGDVGQMLESLR